MSQPKQIGTPRLSIEELRRRELLTAAVAVISERGFDKTTIRDIATAAGASNGSVHYYFETKEVLLRAAVAESDAQFRDYVHAEVSAVEGAVEKLKRIIELCFPDDSVEGPDWSVFIDFWQQAVRDSAFRDIFESANVEWLEMLAGILEEGVAQGELMLGQEPRAEAMALAAAIDGFALHSRVTEHVDGVGARRILQTKIEAFRARQPADDSRTQEGHTHE